MKHEYHPIDLIGDIHGYADPLRALLERLGYRERGGVYRHPERTVVFLGDFIDRGPKIRETLRLVRAMVEAGTARAVMGNHELNAIQYHTPDGRGGHLRSHSAKGGRNTRSHRASLEQIPAGEWPAWIAWFQSLPLFLDLGGLRVVHACWDGLAIAALEGDARLTEERLFAASAKGTPEERAVDRLLKGPEIALPEGAHFADKDGTVRKEVRIKWWLAPEGHTYHSYSLPESGTLPKVGLPSGLVAGYGVEEPPVIIGHYWLPPGRPEPVSANVACIDYSVAKEGGQLTAYRWDGERELRAENMVTVARG